MWTGADRCYMMLTLIYLLHLAVFQMSTCNGNKMLEISYPIAKYECSDSFYTKNACKLLSSFVKQSYVQVSFRLSIVDNDSKASMVTVLPLGLLRLAERQY
jgi:hypothetical protein